MKICPLCDRVITLAKVYDHPDSEDKIELHASGACDCGFIYDRTPGVESVTIGGHTYYEQKDGQNWSNSYVPFEIVFAFYKLLAKVNKLLLKQDK